MYFYLIYIVYKIFDGGISIIFSPENKLLFVKSIGNILIN
jgi:hypothetical protein